LNDFQHNDDILKEVINRKEIDETAFVVDCYGFSQNPVSKQYVIIFEYINGQNFRKHLNEGSLNFGSKISLLCQVLGGLEQIHEKKLIHKDLHMGNVLMRQTNNCTVSDLGLSSAVDEKNNKETIFGVLPYIAPEVLQGEPYTPAADVYSFGMIAYEVLTGRFPFAKDD